MANRRLMPSAGDVAEHAAPPKPLQRAIVGLLLGALLGLVVALVQPRRPSDGDMS